MISTMPERYSERSPKSGSSFTLETKEALNEAGFVILQIESRKVSELPVDIRTELAPFWPKSTEVAIDSSRPFIDRSNNISIREQGEMLKRSESELKKREKMKDVRLLIPDVSTAAQIDQHYQEQKGEGLYKNFYILAAAPRYVSPLPYLPKMVPDMVAVRIGRNHQGERLTVRDLDSAEGTPNLYLGLILVPRRKLFKLPF